MRNRPIRRQSSLGLSLTQKLGVFLRDLASILRNRRVSLPSEPAGNPESFFNLYIFRWRSVYLPIVFGALVALYAPPDVMDQMQWLKPLSNFVRSIFLPMDGYVRKSAFPQVTELYFLLTVLHSPIHFFGMRKELGTPYNRRLAEEAWSAFDGWRKFRLVLALIVCAALVPVSFVLNDGFDFKIIPMNSSRMALASVGWLFAGAIGFMLAGFVTALGRNVLTGKRKNVLDKENQR